MLSIADRGLSEEQRMMRDTCRAFVDDFVTPFVRQSWQREWSNETMGGRFMNNGEIVFEDMAVPKDHLLVEGNALVKAGVYFRPGKIIQAAKNLGVGIAAFDFGVEKLLRDAAIFLHMDGTTDVSKFKIVKAMFPETAGAYAGPEQ